MSLDTFTCDRCGAMFGIFGTNTGSDEDWAADEYYASEVEYHQSGECTPQSELLTETPIGDAAAEHAARVMARHAIAADDADRDLPWWAVLLVLAICVAC